MKISAGRSVSVLATLEETKPLSASHILYDQHVSDRAQEGPLECFFTGKPYLRFWGRVSWRSILPARTAGCYFMGRVTNGYSSGIERPIVARMLWAGSMQQSLLRARVNALFEVP